MKNQKQHIYPNSVFKESGLTFSFNNQWFVTKFDEHRFYKLLAGRGLKGVDFIGIYKEKTLVLMEVKNYIDRYKADGINPTEVFLENPDFFLKKVEQKFEDSLRLIQIVRRFYERKWWYRMFAKKLIGKLPFTFLMQFEWGFWTVVWQLVEEGKVEKVLWLELGEESKTSSKKAGETLILSRRKNAFESSLFVK